MSIASTPDDGRGVNLILVNSGYRGQGYYIHADCGLIAAQADIALRNQADGHHRPYTPMPEQGEDVTHTHASRQLCTCSHVQIENHASLYLGMLFRTDVLLLGLQVQSPFLEHDKSVVRDPQLNDGLTSFKEAFITCLQKEMLYNNREIQGGIRKRAVHKKDGSDDLILEVFLYDDVSGGAGLTSSLMTQRGAWKRLLNILKASKQQLDGTTCLSMDGCETACIGCLLDFRNASEHHRLNRLEGLRILDYILEGNVPRPYTSEIERMGVTFHELIRYIDEGITVAFDGDSLAFSKGQHKVKIYPYVSYVNPYDDPRLVALDDLDIEWEPVEWDEDWSEVDCEALAVPMRGLLREPTAFVERIRAMLNPNFAP